MAEERKVCVVTGSSSGIGAATVKLYAKQGWNVVVNYSREAAPAEAVAERVPGARRRRPRRSRRHRRRRRLPPSRRPGRGALRPRRRPRQQRRNDQVRRRQGPRRPRRRRLPAHLRGQRHRRLPDGARVRADARPPAGRGDRQRLVDRFADGHRIVARLHGEQGRAQRAHDRPGALARPGDPRQRDRAGPGRDAVDAERARCRSLCRDGAELPRPLRRSTP